MGKKPTKNPFSIYIRHDPNNPLDHGYLYLTEHHDDPVIPHPAYYLKDVTERANSVLMEFHPSFHSPGALIALMVGATLEGVDAIVLNAGDDGLGEQLLSLMDHWQRRLGDLGSRIAPLKHPDFFIKLDHSLFTLPETDLEKLRVSGADGIIIPESYNPVKLMNVFSLAREFGLRVLTTVNIYTKPRQIKFALKVNPAIELPDSIMERFEDGASMQAGIDFLLEFISFIRTFDVEGLIIQNARIEYLEPIMSQAANLEIDEENGR